MNAFLRGGDRSNAAVFSVLTSVLTAAFTSAMVNFDKDTSSLARVGNPDFYGYVPYQAKKKALVFVLMFTMSAGQLCVKSFAINLASMASMRILVWFFVVDFALFFLYKLVRSDFTYWLPTSGIMGVLTSFTIRISAKITVDFTAFIHMRHPVELGGAYWFFNIAMTPISCIISTRTYLYNVKSDTNEEESSSQKLSSTQVYGTVGSLCALRVLTSVLFLKTINKEYIHTFVSFRSGDEDIHSIVDKDTDEKVIHIFRTNRNKWKSKEAQVKAWVNEKLPEWLDSEGEWFTEEKRTWIFYEFIDYPSLLKRIRGEDVVAIISGCRPSIVPSFGLKSSNDLSTRRLNTDDPVLRRRRSLVEKARADLQEE